MWQNCVDFKQETIHYLLKFVDRIIQTDKTECVYTVIRINSVMNFIYFRLSIFLNNISAYHYITGTCKVRNERETKRNRTKSNETKRNRSKRNETTLHFVSFRSVSFRFVRFRFVLFGFVSFLFRFALYRYPLLTVGLVKIKSQNKLYLIKSSSPVQHIKNCLPWIFIPRHVSHIFRLQTVTTFEPII